MCYREYCDDCKYATKCKIAYTVNFCENCKDYNDCDIRYYECEAGHEIECNNGFEENNSYCDYDEENENE